MTLHGVRAEEGVVEVSRWVVSVVDIEFVVTAEYPFTHTQRINVETETIYHYL